MKSLNSQHNRMITWSLHLAGIAVVALLLGVFYGVVYKPLHRTQADHAERTQQLDKLMLHTGAEGGEYRRLRATLNEMKASVDELHRQLSDRPSEVEVIKDITAIAERVNLGVLDYEVGTTQSLPTHSQTEVELRCHGSYASICRFLQQAEQLTKTTKLSKVEVQARANSRGYPIQMTFVLYSEGESHDTKEKRAVL